MACFTSRTGYGCAIALLAALGSAAPARADILYAADHGTSAIVKFTSNGVGSDFAGIGTGLAFDHAGNLYASRGNAIEKLTPGGVESVFATSGLSGPEAVAFDSAGNLYAANESNSTIEKFSPTGTDLGVFAASGLVNPRGLAFDSAGNLYASNFSTGTIEKFSPAGSDLGIFGGTGTPQVAGLAFDHVGNLYVANEWSNNIVMFTPGGVRSVFANTRPSSDPLGLAFDSAGNLYVADQQSGGIEMFTPGGIGSVFAGRVLHPYFLAFSNDAGVPLPLANTPEPAGLSLLALGGIGLLRRRRQT